MFHPGETVVHNFIIPFVRTSISEIIVSYKQDDDVFLERTITSHMLNPDVQGGESALVPYDDPARTKFRIRFTQDESLLFDDHSTYKIQLNVYTEGKSRHASCELHSSTGVQHIREVIPIG